MLGWSQHRIAADLGVSQAAVSKLVKRVEGGVLRDLVETLDRHKARQTLRLDYQYTEAIAAWEASKADTTRKRQRKSQGGGRGAEAPPENTSRRSGIFSVTACPSRGRGSSTPTWSLGSRDRG